MSTSLRASRFTILFRKKNYILQLHRPFLCISISNCVLSFFAPSCPLPSCRKFSMQNLLSVIFPKQTVRNVSLFCRLLSSEPRSSMDINICDVTPPTTSISNFAWTCLTPGFSFFLGGWRCFPDQRPLSKQFTIEKVSSSFFFGGGSVIRQRNPGKHF